MVEISLGSVHGRFQPLHSGHMEYILAARARCDFLYVGLTQPDIRNLKPTIHAAHRVLKYSNPLTYFERHQLIHAALLGAQTEPGTFAVIPFPIETPEQLTDYLSTDVVCFTTVYEEWNLTKIRLLETTGYKVEVLWERDYKAIQGNAIRDAIRLNDPSWRSQVPPETVEAVAKLNLQARLATLHAADI